MTDDGTQDSPKPPARALTGAMLALTVAVAAAAALSACAPLLLGGAVIGGMSMYADRRTTGAQLEDEGIEFKAAKRLRATLGDTAHLNVTSYNRVVLLTGEVASEQDRALAEQAVAVVENVRSVVNESAVADIRSVTSRSNDALITAKVKAALIDAKDIQSNAFRVVTERAAVYLMGRVTEREASRAVEIARSIRGVQRVVRVFEILAEDDLKTPPLPAPSATAAAAK